MATHKRNDHGKDRSGWIPGLCGRIETLGKIIKKIGKNAFDGIASGATFKIKAGKKDYKRICKLIKKSGKLPKKAKFKRVS